MAAGQGPGRRGFKCECGGVIGVDRTCPAEDGVLVRYRSCRSCDRGYKGIETLVDDFHPRRSVNRVARAIQRLMMKKEKENHE